ncbi:MAG: hypothetical protein KDE31_22735, partial [Caldilineaceae bacterium]|nr:hypothetical protein [Caldilineaceae bacterium]
TELRHKVTFYAGVKMYLCAAAEYNKANIGLFSCTGQPICNDEMYATRAYPRPAITRRAP